MKTHVLAAASLAAGVLAAAEPKYYTLGVPGVAELRNATNRADVSAWAATNACLAPIGVFWAASYDTNAYAAASSADVSAPVRRAREIAAAFPMERNKPEYYLGDALEAPDDTDWDATYDAFAADAEASRHFLFDTDNRRVYVTLGETTTFTWKLLGGDEKKVVVVASPIASGRPKNIFWTDSQYGGRTVDLTDKFVRFFGPSNLLTTVTNRVSTGSTVGGEESLRDVISSGLYISEESGKKTLYAAGELEGQVVMAYYDSGTYERIVDVQTLQISRPSVEKLTGTVGSQLKPSGRGYDIAGLVASPTTVEDFDTKGPFLYQHACDNTLHALHNAVFALRPTDDTTRNQTQIYWMETDNQGVSWPYEVDEYIVSWPEKMPVYVRGNAGEDVGRSIDVPSVYAVELMKYQEDLGDVLNHASPPENNVFSTSGPGLSLLKLTKGDNVWFMPIRSVWRGDPDWYVACRDTLSVGTEAPWRGGSVSGLAEGRTLEIDPSVPGYIYEAASDPVWNANLYSASGTGATGYPSVVYPVTASMDAAVTNTLEVWWSSSFARDDMPEAVVVPSLPQTYDILWPEARESPDLVIASQLGSAASSIHQTGRALAFDATNAFLSLPARTYFSATSGAFLFWTAPYDARPESRGAASALVSFGDTNGTELVSVWLDGATPQRVHLRFGATELATEVPHPELWSCVAVTWASDKGLALLIGDTEDGATAVTGTYERIDGLGDILTGSRLGATANRPACPYRLIDHFMTWSRCVWRDEFYQMAKLVVQPEQTGITSLFLFDGEEDLVNDGTSERVAMEGVLNVPCRASQCLRAIPGAPHAAAVTFSADSSPAIYRQNDPTACGYNPNEEHAFIRTSGDTAVVWALRNDLNAVAGVSKPGVLVEYAEGGVAKMQWFDVCLTNATYAVLGDDCVAGAQLPGPHPFDYFDTPWLAKTHWTEGDVPPYRDRKGQVWARAAGVFDIYMHYAQQETFDWPSLTAPATGESVPWLSYRSGNVAEPEPWRWNVTWPTNAPALKIGQTLTTASGGLPEVWNAASMAVVYPNEKSSEVVLLTDPTVLRAVPLGCTADDLAKIGLSTEPNGGMQNYKGKYYFLGLPPALSERVYIDPSNDKLCVIGQMEDRTGGVNMLLVNVLTADERATLYGLGTNTYDATVSPLWQAAVEAIARDPVQPTTTSSAINPDTGLYEDRSLYTPVDHYALTAVGGTNYVTLIENDATNSFCDAGNPIQMRILKVVPEFYVGRVVTREDELNQLSQMLGIHYTEAFAGAADDFVFDWRRKSPEADGTVPYDFDTGYVRKFSEEEGEGLTSFTVGGQGDTLANLVNTYWTCRYRAKTNTLAAAVMSTNWSAWCSPPALAEGWVQRVLNNITPFTQRMTDLYNNAVDTSVSMIRQAGAPYEGDVALNQENLSSVGLIQLYRTIFNKAESMSLAQGIDDADANKQLLLAAERLADLYIVLGDEAYADAINPTIGFGSNFGEYETGLTIDYGAASSALFCFDNQVPTLLDEELALLRGRSCLEAPGCTTSPYFNRLVWNFTKGITAGEVAYAVNYNISDNNSGEQSATIDETTAAALYPQGHGDAYGHYLSALQGYYRLLRNPYFSWGVPGMSEMNVADTVVNVDYYDEAKFAEAAADVAKVARRTVELTALKHWRDNGASATGGGYADACATNAFGYGEWAVRGGLGALCNWVVANSLLPEEETADGAGVAYDDQGLLHIDRGTVTELTTLADAFSAIQLTCDRMDAGLNPLGLDEKALPFDLTPIGAADGATHFEQIRARAGEAFENARKILDRAQTYASRLRLIAESEAAIADQSAQMEASYYGQLVAIYGKPYSDDIGPSATYPQDYDGPDYYHYMWMDLESFGLTSVADTLAVTTETFDIQSYASDGSIEKLTTGNLLSGSGQTLTYSLSANGVVVKNADISGERLESGSLQVAYADFLSAYANVQQKLMLYERARDFVDLQVQLALELQEAREKLAAVEDRQLDGANGNSESDSIKGYITKLADEQKSLVAFNATLDSVSTSINIVGALGGIAGLANSVGDVVKSGAFAGLAVTYGIAHAITSGLEGDIANCEQQISLCQNALERADRDYAGTVDRIESWSRASDAVEAEAQAVADLTSAWTALASAQEQISALLAQANCLRQDRELARKQFANNISKLRYNDMFFRKLSNNALAQYDTAFDLARRHAFLAAKAYGYESGSPIDSTDEGAALLRQIVAARALGETNDDGEPIVSDAGDAGLAGALAKMDANWKTLKTQLGLNNPQEYATWYSLRHGLYRILPGETGDAAWATELSKHWVEDVRDDAAFRRYCQPFASTFGLAEKEPGLVIEFATTIDFAANLFGKPLAFKDAQMDSTYFATKIAAAGVWFEGYDERTENAVANAGLFSTTPNVYLVPVGVDRMRVPGSDGAEIAEFEVVDQTIPVPYPLTAAELAEANWLPSYLDGALGGADAVSRLRRHPSFRAYYGDRDVAPTDAALDATRLVGRSVWNTRWLLIIPAGTLNADRDAALKAFIYGADTDRDGRLDTLPVRDIKIGFKTYSMGGK